MPVPPQVRSYGAEYGVPESVRGRWFTRTVITMTARAHHPPEARSCAAGLGRASMGLRASSGSRRGWRDGRRRGARRRSRAEICSGEDFIRRSRRSSVRILLRDDKTRFDGSFFTSASRARTRGESSASSRARRRTAIGSCMRKATTSRASSSTTSTTRSACSLPRSECSCARVSSCKRCSTW